MQKTIHASHTTTSPNLLAAYMRSNVRLGGETHAGGDAGEQLSFCVGEIIHHSTRQAGNRSKQERAGANGRAEQREAVAIDEEKREKNRDVGLAKERRGNRGEKIDGGGGKPDIHVQNDVMGSGAVGNAEIAKMVDGEANSTRSEGNELDENESIWEVVGLNEMKELGMLVGVNEDDDDDFAVCYKADGMSPVPAIQNLLNEFEAIHHGDVDHREFHRRMRGIVRLGLEIRLFLVSDPNANPFVRQEINAFRRRTQRASIADRFIRRNVHLRLEELLQSLVSRLVFARRLAFPCLCRASFHPDRSQSAHPTLRTCRRLLCRPLLLFQFFQFLLLLHRLVQLDVVREIVGV